MLTSRKTLSLQCWLPVFCSLGPQWLQPACHTVRTQDRGRGAEALGGTESRTAESTDLSAWSTQPYEHSLQNRLEARRERCEGQEPHHESSQVKYVYYPAIHFSHLECSGPWLQACSFLLWAHAIQIFWISLLMFRSQSRDLFLCPVCQWERVCCASCLSHALCDFLLMVCGVLKHNNVFKRHLLLYKLKNTDVLFVSLILKPIVLFLTMLVWTVERNCICWMRNDCLASGNTMFWLLSFIMCSNHMAIHLLFFYWTTVLQTCTEHAARKSRCEGVNGS